MPHNRRKPQAADPLTIWRRELNPRRLLDYPVVRPATTLTALVEKLGAVLNVLPTLENADAHEPRETQLATSLAGFFVYMPKETP